MELWQGALSLQILLTAKGNISAGCAWTMFLCLQNGEGGDAERIFRVTFLIGVGLFLCIFWIREQQQRLRNLLFESKMATHYAYCFPVWATGSGLGPFFPYFSWDYFCTKTAGRHEERFRLCLPVPEALVLGIPSASQVSFLGTRWRKEALWDPALTIFQGNVSICQILVP